jgi:HEPN domain-containing protein
MPAEFESQRYKDWFAHAELDMADAKVLLKYKGSSETIAFHLQQAAEKYIKGYLVKHGWSLKKIHDIEALLTAASRYNEFFREFLDLGRLISAAYIESRYPSGPPKEYSYKQITEWLAQTEKLITFIKEQD